MTRKKQTRKKGKHLSAGQLKTEVIKLFKISPRKRLNAKQIIKKLKVGNNRDSVQDAIIKLAEENKLIPVGDHKFRLNQKTAYANMPPATHIGIVDMTRTGSAYVVCEGLKDDVYVPAKNINSALNGDKVEVSVFTPPGRRRPEGEIIKVLERFSENFIGTLRHSKKYAIVIPDKLNMPVDIFVEPEDTKGAKDGEKVVVKITKWPTRKNFSPIGVVTSILGEAGSHDIEMKAILINNGFNLEFPDEVIAESEVLQADMTEEEIEKRRDMRDVLTFTIDPETAKDFDDALSIRDLDDGQYEVGVHIADVTHFVKPGTALDKEAYRRSTSVYLVDRVLPMLPEKISNELCSLRPNEDKFTFSAVFIFDKNGKITDRWFGKTLTHSNRRFAYEDVQQILEIGQGEFVDELKKLNSLAGELRKQKFKNGAIDFESEEVKFELDEKGAPIRISVKERKEAHMLIEDFMLLANREVATFIANKGKEHEIPFVYRVHDLPNADKVADLARFAKELGFEIKMDTPRQIADSYNRLAKAARSDEALRMLEPIAIRTMAKAAYTAENIGHYGLAFQYYTHFTSPIRRYSDVLSHRIFEKNIHDVYREKKDQLEEQCKHISAQERNAMSAERESVKYKQVEFIEKHIGEEFTGYISGIIDRGFFVELSENKCEGMVGFDTLDDAYQIDDSRLKVSGLRTKKVFKMGDLVTVRIISANLSKRQIEMELVD